ncbi:hypothetical protein VTO42DRAFT_2425 [Malbranchea cinnamomea]
MGSPGESVNQIRSLHPCNLLLNCTKKPSPGRVVKGGNMPLFPQSEMFSSSHCFPFSCPSDGLAWHYSTTSTVPNSQIQHAGKRYAKLECLDLVLVKQLVQKKVPVSSISYRNQDNFQTTQHKACVLHVSDSPGLTAAIGETSALSPTGDCKSSLLPEAVCLLRRCGVSGVHLSVHHLACTCLVDCPPSSQTLSIALPHV